MEMRMELQKLTIDNFKGIGHLELSFHAGVNSLYGDNATGKSTVFDAMTWLLFDKDSSGSAKFAIKPTHAAAGVIPTVTALFQVNGQPLKLQKSLREKWEKHRGSATARFAGHTVDYFVDDVPRKEGEYKTIIAGYIDEGRFRLLTNVYAFARDMHWKDRRALLAELCRLPDDRELLASNDDFLPLLDKLGSRSVDEYKQVLVSQRKGMNTELDTLPIRIDECSKSVEHLSQIDFEAERDRYEKALVERQNLQVELARLDADALTSQYESQVATVSAEIQQIKGENSQHRASQIIPLVDETRELEKAVAMAHDQLAKADERYRLLNDSIDTAKGRLEDYRKRWKDIDGETFTVETCSACGQALPPDKVEQIRQVWREQQKSRQDRLLADSGLIKKDIADKEQQLKLALGDVSSLSRELETAQDKLDKYQPPRQPDITDLPDYQERLAGLESQLAQAKDQLAALKNNKVVARDSITFRIAQVDEHIKALGEALAAQETLEQAKRRVEELTAMRQSRAQALEELEQDIELCEQFSRFRAQQVEERVNGEFRLARFQLFTQQINGSMTDCCQVMVGNVPYDGGLNAAMKINVGLDIIRTLSRHYGQSVPLFIDNAESVTGLQEIDGQVIRLVVSENDKELRLV